MTMRMMRNLRYRQLLAEQKAAVSAATKEISLVFPINATENTPDDSGFIAIDLSNQSYTNIEDYRLEKKVGTSYVEVDTVLQELDNKQISLAFIAGAEGRLTLTLNK